MTASANPFVGGGSKAARHAAELGICVGVAPRLARNHRPGDAFARLAGSCSRAGEEGNEPCGALGVEETGLCSVSLKAGVDQTKNRPFQSPFEAFELSLCQRCGSRIVCFSLAVEIVKRLLR